MLGHSSQKSPTEPNRKLSSLCRSLARSGHPAPTCAEGRGSIRPDGASRSGRGGAGQSHAFKLIFSTEILVKTGAVMSGRGVNSALSQAANSNPDHPRKSGAETQNNPINMVKEKSHHPVTCYNEINRRCRPAASQKATSSGRLFEMQLVEGRTCV